MNMAESFPEGKRKLGKRRDCSEQAISLFPSRVLKIIVLQTHKNNGLFGKGLEGCILGVINPSPHNSYFFMCLQYQSFENTVGKGEIARNEQFLLSPQVFSTCLDNFLPFSSISKWLSAKSSNLEECKIYCFGKA